MWLVIYWSQIVLNFNIILARGLPIVLPYQSIPKIYAILAHLLHLAYLRMGTAHSFCYSRGDYMIAS